MEWIKADILEKVKLQLAMEGLRGEKSRES